MPDSPLSASPYEILRVPRTASDEDLRRAYRIRQRETHPDTGGSAGEFDQVQRAWELLGTPEARRAFDAGRPAAAEQASWAPAPPRARRDSRPQARASGHPGGWYRERYLEQMREWMGRGTPLDDPYDPALVRSAPREIRHLLAAAVAEEESARRMAGLGIGFTIWHDVATAPGKLDHVVLGPTGLWAVQSEDWGEEVALRRGEVIGRGLQGERPFHELSAMARSLGREARAKFSALLLVVPDDHAPTPLERVGSLRGSATVLVERSRMAHLLRQGLPDVGVGGTDLFELRTRIQGAVRFV
ncbi:J domain-containing protein [Homoserinibacter sp. YIM 151385]|uniref:J domain-containing protein n=1 Tax=Homoserinibacter sp. YIM 151385 TaxID=2985506 RepID=UPI0022F0514F|nr:J domain-containing protein [Homoserinibacter sp. YIM 151385]WBU38359.1 J domain-containing protein [Homoserinibacter sp. YIM 151385]